MGKINTLAATSMLMTGALLTPLAAQALPSFARQTGMSCAMCHTVFPQLTPYGRMFKLQGYTTAAGMFAEPAQQHSNLSEVTSAPLAAMMQVSYTALSKSAAGKPNTYTDFPDQLSLFYAGRLSTHMGAFAQLTIDNTGSFGMDNTDIRAANTTSTANGKELIYGVSLNNGPTMEDVFNTTPVWSFPSASSPEGAGPPGTFLLGNGNVNATTAGLVAYGMYDNSWYGAVGVYHSTGLSGGGDAAATIYGWAPYLRVAYQQDNGTNNWEVGAYAMDADMTTLNAGQGIPNDPTVPRSKVSDLGVDAQYQIRNGVNTFTGRLNYITEKVDNAQNLGILTTSTGSVKISTLGLSGTYYYDRKQGATLGLYSVSGDKADYYSGNAGQIKPDSSYIVAEYDYLPYLNTKFAVQYTAFNKLNGTSTNASDNNNLYLNAWFMF